MFIVLIIKNCFRFYLKKRCELLPLKFIKKDRKRAKQNKKHGEVDRGGPLLFFDSVLLINF